MIGMGFDEKRPDTEKRLSDLREWLMQKSGPDWRLFVKILSGNDTLANNANQAGPYVPKRVVFELFPSIAKSQELNPRKRFPAYIDSHRVTSTPTAIWYNNRIAGDGSRNETRLTGWGGAKSPLMDPEATGSLVAFAFNLGKHGEAVECRVWLCSSPDEEEAILEHVGPVEGGQFAFLDALGAVGPKVHRDRPCAIRPEEFDPAWMFGFPTTADVVAMTIARLPSASRELPDKRLLARRECEYELFRSIEAVAVLPRIKEGFSSVDVFVEYANSVTNRRKARSGASLGLQMSVIFGEEQLPFSYDSISEGRKRPDFLFPSAEAYRTGKARNLRMLAAKTTCKDRWRQILNEADRIPRKHLLTLQPGLSANQYDEMRKAGVVLVVPKALHAQYPKSVRSELLDVATFIRETRMQCLDDG